MAPAARAVAALVLLAALPTAAAVAPAVQYNYTAGGTDWNQTSGWGTCGSGVQQSPIVITDSAATYNPAMLPLQLSYGESTAWTLEVTVNYMEVANIDTVTTGASTYTANAFTDGITLDGTFIPLNQFHFHSPSEHSINGVHYPLEMHMVHKLYQTSASNTAPVPANTGGTSVLAKAAVIGIMFAYDPADADGAFLAKLMPVFKTITGLGADDSDDQTVKSTTETTDTTYGGDVFFNLTSDVFGIIGTSAYYRYNGSLTTPPCTEGINWINMANPLTLSSRQLLAFTQMLATEQEGDSRGSDNRLIQPVNNRPIYSTVPPPAPTLISGSFQFNTNLPASQMSSMEDELAAGLAAQLGVDSSDVIIGGFSDVPGASGSGLDVQVAYSIAAASAASASTISQAIAAGSLIPSGGTTSSLAAGLAAAYPDLGIASMSAALPSSVASSDPALAFASVATANAALTANVLSLAAAAAAAQSNITATMATLAALVASRMPGPAPAIYVTVTHTLGGYTTATFGSAQAAQFIAALAASVSVSASAVTITNVADVPAAGHRRHRRKALGVVSPSGRALMQSGGGVAVSSSIQVASTGLATVVSAALVASPITAASLQAAGLTSCTGVAVSTPPATVSGGAAPTDATGSLPQTAPEPVSRKAGARLLLLLILLLLLLPIGAAAGFVVHSRKKNAAQAAQEQEQEKGFSEAEAPEDASPRPPSPPPSASAGPGSRRLGKKRNANKMGFLDDSEPTTPMPATA